jgi:DNA-binding transcriptional LysR family regulator
MEAVGAAIRLLQTAEIDIVLGRAEWVGQPAMRLGLGTRLIRYEALAVLLPAAHPLAAKQDVPVAALSGMEVDLNPANPEAPEWSDVARQFLVLSGAVATPPHYPATGIDQADHLVRQGLPILTGVDHAPVPGGVVRRLVDPIPIFPWSLIWRRGIQPSILATIERAAAELAAEGDWLTLPAGAWLPEPEASRSARR